MNSSRRAVSLGFGDVSGGVFTVDPSVSARPNQVADCLNAQFKRRGFQRWPGVKGISATLPLADQILSGLGSAMETDGDEALFASDTDGKIYRVNTSTGAFVEAIDNGGIAESSWGDFRGTGFVANGSYPVKIESAAAYRVGIAVPSAAGVTTAAVAGGSLAAGVYKIKIGYARKISGSIVLFSQAVDLADVTLAASNLTVRITGFPNSSDAQVNDKVVWMTDAGGLVHYYYHETGNNSTTTVDITSATLRNVSLLYETQAGDNYLPGNFEHLYVFNDQLWGSVANVAYASKRAGTVYDLERFPADNYIILPYQITGIFSLGEHLYFNTPRGVFRQPYGDLSARYVYVGKGYRWFRMQTVADWGDIKIGLTNNGVRTFDGERFSEFDYSKDVKNLIARCYVGQDVGYRCTGVVYRRSNRTEYHLCYMDTSVGITHCNRRLVLNLDRVVVQGQEDYRTPWEICDHGANFQLVTSAGSLYMTQSSAAGTLIYQEDTSTTYEQYVLTSAGIFGAVQSPRRLYLRGKDVMTDMMSEFDCEALYILAQISETAIVRLSAADSTTIFGQGTMNGGEYSIYETAAYDAAKYASENPVIKKFKLPAHLKARLLYWEFDQTANDPTLQVIDVTVVGVMESGRFV